jgi:uracil-DNA glycosylase
MRVLFIGQGPSKDTADPITNEQCGPPFSGKCGKRLAHMMGVDQDKMLEMFDFENVLTSFYGHGPDGKGDLFPADVAAKAAFEMIPRIDGRVVVFLGSNVAKAFKVQPFDYFSWVTLERPGCMVLGVVAPHPSGVNRYWNDPVKRKFATNFYTHLTAANFLLEELPIQKASSAMEWTVVVGALTAKFGLIRKGGEDGAGSVRKVHA